MGNHITLQIPTLNLISSVIFIRAHQMSFFACILFVTSNHQTTNLVFPNFFLEFFSVWGDEKENKLFIGPKLRKKLFGTNLFQLLKLRKNRGKNWGKQYSWFGGLMSWTIHSFLNSNICLSLRSLFRFVKPHPSVLLWIMLQFHCFKENFEVIDFKTTKCQFFYSVTFWLLIGYLFVTVLIFF